MAILGTRKAVRGYINFIEEAQSTQATFQYNPTEVRRSHGWDWGKQPVPRRSHPHYSGGAGTEEKFSFVLQLDADRGTLDTRRKNNVLLNDVDAFLASVQNPPADIRERVLDLRPLLDLFMQHTLPGEKNGDPAGLYGVPRRILLNLGSVLRAEVALDNVEETITKYGSTHNVLRANLAIDGHVVVPGNVTNRMLVEGSSSQQERELNNLPDPIQLERFTALPNVE